VAELGFGQIEPASVLWVSCHWKRSTSRRASAGAKAW
jgi:hypothetical protein